MIAVKQRNSLWLALLLLVIGSNIAIYNTGLYDTLQIEQNPDVVIGSLLDFIIVAPFLAIIYLKNKSWKIAITLVATGCILARLAIPQELLSPYKHITTAGIAIELAIIVFELSLIALLIVYLPKIIRQVKASTKPLVFAYPKAIQSFSKNPIITLLSYEMLVFYYTFASWKVQQPNGITLHKGTSFMAFQVMIIHAIVLESLGLHWWLHGQAPILSTILLILNIYGVLFIIADIRAMKLNPIQLDDNGFYIARGLLRRAYIDYRNIEAIVTEPGKQRSCVDFIAPDFETPPAQMILKMKCPQQVDLMYGMKKYYHYVAITCDDFPQLQAAIEKGMGK